MTRPPTRRGCGGSNDADQFQIEWTRPSTNGHPAAPSPPEPVRGRAPTVPAELPADPQPLVQRLRWDFRSSFPEPAPEAIDAGLMSDEDCDPENVRSLHEEHGRESLAVLKGLDAIGDARRRGIDPATGKTPRTTAARERLHKQLAAEIERLERWWTTLMDTYEAGFGSEAAVAFGKAIRAWHAGVKVFADPPRRGSASAPADTRATDPLPPPAQDATVTRSRRVTSHLPVPEPLPDAVAAGRFGQEEDGRHVRPGPHEVRTITKQHAEKLGDLLDASIRARGSCLPGEAARLDGLFAAGLAAYAEDFGHRAAEQLDAHVRRCVDRERSATGRSGRRR